MPLFSQVHVVGVTPADCLCAVCGVLLFVEQNWVRLVAISFLYKIIHTHAHMCIQVSLDGKIMGDVGDFYFLFVLSNFSTM